MGSAVPYVAQLELADCAAACLACNTRKGDRTPEQAGMRLRRRPVRPEWKPFYAAGPAPMESWSRFLKHEPAMAMAMA